MAGELSNGGDATPSLIPLDQRHPKLQEVLVQFHRTIDALRDMLDEFVPHVQQQDRERFGPKALARVRSLSPSQQEKLKELLDSQIEQSRSSNGLPTSDELRRILGAEVREVFEGDRHTLVSYLRHVMETVNGPDRATLVLNSLLAQAISALEVLVAGVATRHFIAHPTALDDETKTFSLAEVREFTDPDDPADLLISQEVTTMIYGNLDDWASWFKKNCNTDFRILAMDWDTLTEAFQRRHIVLHNGGNVSRQYLSRAPDPDPNLQVGDSLNVDEDYLTRAIDEVDVFGSLLLVKAWGTWNADERDTSAGYLLQRSYDLMLRERWDAVQTLTNAGGKLRCSAHVLEPIKVNGWHSRAQTEGYAAIRNEVVAWDVSASAGRFQLVRHVLPEQFDEAETVVNTLIRQGEVSKGELNEWPVLSNLRAHLADKMGTLPSAGSSGSPHQSSNEDTMDR